LKTPTKIGAIQKDEAKPLEDVQPDTCNELNMALPATTDMIDVSFNYYLLLAMSLCS